MYIKNNNKMFTDSEYEFYRNKSFDNKYLKMQNSQNLQILQEEKMYQILIPMEKIISVIFKFHLVIIINIII